MRAMRVEGGVGGHGGRYGGGGGGQCVHGGGTDGKGADGKGADGKGGDGKGADDVATVRGTDAADRGEPGAFPYRECRLVLVSIAARGVHGNPSNGICGSVLQDHSTSKNGQL